MRDKGGKNGDVTINPKQKTVEGSVRTFGTFAGRYHGQKIYFVVKFDQDFSNYGIWDGVKFSSNHQSATVITYWQT